MTLNPYIGARPYGPSDDTLFFGREMATASLVERIALRPLTILTAPSGIGKTSLLRAAVIPDLERDGMSVVYMRPDPTNGEAGSELVLGCDLAHAMGVGLLPDPAAELICLDRIMNNCGATTLGDAQAWFASLNPGDDIRRKLLAPVRGPLDQTPELARYLRGTLHPLALGAQLERLGAGYGKQVDQDTRLTTLKRVLRSSGLAEGVSAARAALAELRDESGPMRAVLRLARGDENDPPLLVRPDGDEDYGVRVTLIIDQFEQLFTHFSPAVRSRALSRLGAMLEADLPLNLVLSLRKEWYADLIQHMPQLRQRSETADRTTFYLLPLERSEAELVMTKPPRQVGEAPVAPESQRAIWEGLQQDDTIDAFALSIACYELFEARNKPGEAAADLSEIDTLLSAHLRRAIGEIAPANREEALDILAEVVGSGTTRGFVTHSKILSAPLRSPKLRADVLSGLQSAFLIKGDNPRRNLDKVYDVMHERLLEPLRQYIGTHPSIAAFREAAERLLQADEGGLYWSHCYELLKGWKRLSLDPRSAAILLRSIIQELNESRLATACMAGGPLYAFSPNPSAREKVGALFKELAKIAAAPAPPDMPLAERASRSWWLTADEVASRLDARPDLQTDCHAISSAIRHRESALRSVIRQLADRVGAEASALSDASGE